MNINRGARYFSGMDILNSAHIRESAVYLEHGLNPNLAHSLPLDTGVKGAAEIYGIRAAAIVKVTGAVALRSLGIDAAARLIANKKFPV